MLYLEQLKAMKCGDPSCADPNCDEFFLHGRCHISSPNKVWFETGMLSVQCGECSSPIANIAVVQNDNSPQKFKNVWTSVKDGKITVKDASTGEVAGVFAARSEHREDDQ